MTKETIEDRVKRVSIANLGNWSEAAEYHAQRGERAAALVAAKHVRSILGAYNMKPEPGHVFASGSGRAIHKLTRIGGRGTRYVVRLRADGSVTKEQRWGASAV